MRKYIFGPVPSRRLGLSLGVDIVPLKTCSFDCIYCQLGRTTVKTFERCEYVPAAEVLNELEHVLSEGDTKPDYITFSGSGEPTLNSAIGDIIMGIKAITDVPVAVITNGSLLYMKSVRDDLQKADLVIPSLDAATQETFEQINRPAPSGANIEQIIDGIRQFCDEFTGAVWLEIMLPLNTHKEELQRLKAVTETLNVEKIQLNTVVRPPAETFALPMDATQMQEIKAHFGPIAEVIADFSRVTHKSYHKDVETEILTLLRRRPCTIADISESLSIHQSEVIKYIDEMAQHQLINAMTYEDRQYYQVKG